LWTFVLGEFRLAVDGAPPSTPHGLPAEILALLSLEPGRSVPTARIIEQVWAPDPPDRAAARLHVHVSRIRRLLRDLGCPDVLHTRADGYALDVDPELADHRRFESDALAGLVAAARGDAGAAARLLAGALGLWRGPMLGELGDRDWARPAVVRLTALRRQATDAWADALLALGEHAAVVETLERELLDDPLRERTAGLLMTALYRDGRQADALNTFVRTRAALSDELGVDPSPALNAVYVAILRHDPAIEPVAHARAEPQGTDGPRPVVDLPPRPAPLVGRAAQLAAVEEAAAKPADGPRVVVLTGLGGVGKSRLAMEAAYRAAVPGGAQVVWWVPAGDPVAAVEALGRLATSLGVAEHADQSVRLARLWQELGRRDGWFLVYDDCVDPAGFTTLCPQVGGGTVVVTTRHRAWGRLGRVVAVDVLGLDDSVHLLTSIAGDDDEETAAGLARRLGNLPLALVQAGAYADQTGMSLAHYAGIFDHRRLALLSRAVPDDHRLGVAATWAMSLDQIAARAPAAAALLDLCAALGPADVPLALLSGAAVVLDGPLARVVADELALEDAIAELLRFSLVARHGSGLSLHPLLRAVLRERLAPEAADAARLRVDRILRVCMPADPERAADWPRWSWWVPHALDVAAHHDAAGEPARAVPLLFAAARYLRARAIYPAARDAAERALDGALRTGERGDVQVSLAALTSHLGLVLEHLGDLPAARRQQERALELLRKAGGTGTGLEATVLVRLGGVLCWQRYLMPAVAAYERALSVLDRIGAEPEVGRCLTDLALAHWMAGRPERALATFERAVEILERRVGARHPDMAHARSGQAVVLQDLGDVEGAYALQSGVVATLVETFGEQHPDVAHALDKLAYMDGLLGRRQDGIAGHRRALLILESVYGPDHVELGMPLTNMGVMHLAEGEHDRAAAAQERARALFTLGFGPHHPHTALATRRLGVVRAAQGRRDEAEALLRTALTDTVTALGADHPDALATRGELDACRPLISPTG